MIVLFPVGILIALLAFFVFIDQARWTRRDTHFHFPSRPSTIALTFDDGPDPLWTPQLLAILTKHNIPATFFLIGKKVDASPRLVPEILRGGHAVGNHTYEHGPFWRFSLPRMKMELKKTDAALLRAGGGPTRLFRPPKGILRPRQKELLRSWGYETVLWSINSKDWAGFGPRALAAKILRQERGGEVVLMHDGGGITNTWKGSSRKNTLIALETIIPALKDRGRAFVSLRDLPGTTAGFSIGTTEPVDAKKN